MVLRMCANNTGFDQATNQGEIVTAGDHQFASTDFLLSKLRQQLFHCLLATLVFYLRNQ
jgi:hypothetical protein